MDVGLRTDIINSDPRSWFCYCFLFRFLTHRAEEVLFLEVDQHQRDQRLPIYLTCGPTELQYDKVLDSSVHRLDECECSTKR